MSRNWILDLLYLVAFSTSLFPWRYPIKLGFPAMVSYASARFQSCFGGWHLLASSNKKENDTDHLRSFPKKVNLGSVLVTRIRSEVPQDRT